MKPTAHHYAALAIAIAVFVISVALYIVIYVEVRNQTNRTAAAFANVAAEEALQRQESMVTMTLASTSDARATVATYFIPQDQTVSFIEQVEGVAKQSGASVTIASISADDISSAPKGKTGHIVAHISVNGAWHTIMRALHIIEDFPYALDIDSLSMRALSSGVWNVEFNLVGLIIK